MTKAELRQKRKTRDNLKTRGDRHKLIVFRSLKHISAQLVLPNSGRVLGGLSTSALKDKGTKTELAFILGKKMAELAQGLKVTEVVFDKNGCRYHGRVKAVADGAREGGLQL